MYCSSCGEDIPLGVRFCNHCGTATGSELMRGGGEATVDPDATRVAGQDPADPDLTRLAGRDSEATRVSTRLPFDDRGVAPSRVEHIQDRNSARALNEPRRDPRPPVEPPRPAPAAPPVNSAVERRPAPAPDIERRPTPAHDDEHVIFTVRPTLLFVGIGYACAALGAVALTALLAVLNWLSPAYSVLVSLPLLLIPAFYHLRRNSVRYTLTDSKIEIDQGFISRRTRNIPLRNIQDVTVATTIPQRLMRFGDLIIDNANEVGGSTFMRNIPEPRRHADLLLRELRRWG